MLSFPVSRAHNEEEKYRRVREHIEELLRDEPQADVIKDMLEELFFVEVPKAFRRPNVTIRRQGTKTYREAKRLTHPDCFPKYFLYRLPKEEKLSDQAVEDLIRQWSQASESCVEELVEESLRQNQAAGQLPELLLKLRTFMALIAPTHIAAIVRGLCRSVSFLSRDFIYPGSSEYHLVEELILWMIEELADSAAIQSLLDAVVEEVPNQHFAVLIVASCHGRPRRDLQRIFHHQDLSVLRRKATQRLNTYYVEQNRDIFSELPEEDWGLVLYQWGTDWMASGVGNRSIVQEYVLGLIDRHPAYLGSLLEHFIDRSFGQQEGGFRYSEFSQLYDPTIILERLDRYGDGAFISPEERQAASFFRQEYVKSQEPQTDPEGKTPHA